MTKEIFNCPQKEKPTNNENLSFNNRNVTHDKSVTFSKKQTSRLFRKFRISSWPINPYLNNKKKIEELLSKASKPVNKSILIISLLLQLYIALSELLISRYRIHLINMYILYVLLTISFLYCLYSLVDNMRKLLNPNHIIDIRKQADKAAILLLLDVSTNFVATLYSIAGHLATENLEIYIEQEHFSISMISIFLRILIYYYKPKPNDSSPNYKLADFTRHLQLTTIIFNCISFSMELIISQNKISEYISIGCLLINITLEVIDLLSSSTKSIENDPKCKNNNCDIEEKTIDIIRNLERTHIKNCFNK